MKNLVMVVTVCLFFVGLIACGGGGKYADAREATEEMIDLMNDFADSLEKAEDGKTVVAAIEKFVDKFQAAQKKMEELSKKYPEFKGQENSPEELKDLMPRLEEASNKMGSVMMKIAKFASDPEVAKALGKLQQVK
jgi:TolA-binding protein